GIGELAQRHVGTSGETYSLADHERAFGSYGVDGGNGDTGPAATFPPSPLIRNGIVSKLFGMTGKPTGASGKTNVNMGERYCPDIIPRPGVMLPDCFATSTVPCRVMAAYTRVTGRKSPLPTSKRNRPLFPFPAAGPGSGSAVPRRRRCSAPLLGSMSTAKMSTSWVESVTNPVATISLFGSGNGIVPPCMPSVPFAGTLTGIPPVPIVIRPSCR